MSFGGSYDRKVCGHSGRVNLWKGRGPRAIRVTVEYAKVDVVYVISVWRNPA